jgi:predicted Zn-dependent protease
MMEDRSQDGKFTQDSTFIANRQSLQVWAKDEIMLGRVSMRQEKFRTIIIGLLLVLTISAGVNVLCTPVLGRESPLALDLQNPDKTHFLELQQYMVALRRQIQSNWFAPNTSKQVDSVVLFQVNPDGSVLLRDESKQSRRAADDSAVQAIMGSGPFESPPTGTLKIKATFRPYLLQNWSERPDSTLPGPPVSTISRALSALNVARKDTTKLLADSLGALAPPPKTAYGYGYIPFPSTDPNVGQYNPYWAPPPYMLPPPYATPYQLMAPSQGGWGANQMPVRAMVPPSYPNAWTNFPVQQQQNTLSPEALRSNEVYRICHEAEKYLKSHNWTQAHNLYSRAISLDPNSNSATTHYNFAVACQNNGDFDEAAHHYKVALKYKPEMITAIMNLGSVYQMEGNVPKAIAWLNRYLDVDPNSAKSDEARSMIEFLEAHAQLGSGDSDAPDYLVDASAVSGVTKWADDRMLLKIYIEKKSSVSGFRKAYPKIFSQCIEEWINAAGGKLAWTETNNRELADITCDWQTLAEEKSSRAEGGVTKSSTIKAADGRNTMAHADITIFTKTLSGMNKSDDEIRLTCLHEVGHSLGLIGHSSSNRDIIFFSTAPTQQSTLSERDRRTIAQLYSPLSTTFDKQL